MYVDGFLAPVPTANKAAYLKIAKVAAKVFKDYGAVEVVECWGDDVPDGKLNSMNSAVLLKKNETVVFSWIVWPSKAARTAGIKKAMADPRMKMDPKGNPFDGKRMIFGGFKSILNV